MTRGTAKFYVKESIEITVDDEELLIVECCQSNIQPLSYIIFIEK